MANLDSIESSSDLVCTMEKKNFFSSVSIHRSGMDFVQIAAIGDIIVLEDSTLKGEEKIVPRKPWRLAQVVGFCFSGRDKLVLVQYLWPFKAIKELIADNTQLTKNERPQLLLFRKPELCVDICSVSNILPIRVMLDNIDLGKNTRNPQIGDDGVQECWFQIRNFQINVDRTVTCITEGFVKGIPPLSVKECWKQLPSKIVKNTTKLGRKFEEFYQPDSRERFQILPTDETNEETPSQDTPKTETKNEIPTKKGTKNKARDNPRKRKLARGCEPESIKKAATATQVPPICLPGPAVYTHRKSRIVFFDKVTLPGADCVVGDMVAVAPGNDVGQILSILQEHGSSTLLVEIRWFYTEKSEFPDGFMFPSDLRSGEVIEVDEHVGRVEASSIKSRVRLSSTKQRGCLLCRYSFSTRHYSGAEGLTPVRHWSGEYNSRRGLACSKAWPGKIPKLLELYGGSDHASDEKDLPSSTLEWGTDLLGGVATATPVEPQLHSERNRVYWYSLKSRLVSNRSHLGVQRTLFIRLGDLVCIAASGRGSHCHPFFGPWRVGQVLSIYRERNESLKLEVRWFLRRHDFAKEMKNWMPTLKDSSMEDIFETNNVESEVDANHILGGVRLYLQNETIKRTQEKSNLHALPLRCAYFFLDQQASFQPIPPTHTSLNMVTRGLAVSRFIAENHILSQTVQFYLEERPVPKGNSALSSFLDESLGNDDNRLGTHKKGTAVYTLFVSCSGATCLTKFVDEANLIDKGEDRNTFRWTIRVGDTVAVEDESHTKTNPFTVGWAPAQVLAIYNEESEVKDGKTIQVRWFCRDEDIEVSLPKPGRLDGLPGVVSSDKLCDIRARDILGPVHVVPASLQDQQVVSRNLVWDSYLSGIPNPLFVYIGQLTSGQQNVEPVPFTKLVQEGLERSALYNSELRSKLVNALISEQKLLGEETFQLPLRCLEPVDVTDLGSSDLSGDQQDTGADGLSSKVWFPFPPIHVDHETGIDFFDRVCIAPPSCIARSSRQMELHRSTWTVKLGDLVVLHYNGKSSGEAVYLYGDAQIDATEKVFPGNWAVAEVVNIMKGSGRDKLEIRWFFRHGEVPGISEDPMEQTSLACEEIFESDLYDQVPADCIWGPVLLHDRKQEISVGLSSSGLPMVEFFCRQSWSQSRKCVRPISGIEKRIDRGRERSPLLKKNPTLKSVLDEHSIKDTPSVGQRTKDEVLDWKHAFTEVVVKLSLTDASKEAIRNLSAIIGRSKEKKALSTFVRESICGRSGTGKRPSLFVAGPPGTGKTACVKAVIHGLQSSMGRNCPKFQFITINGMETRHPHDAYAKLLNELSTETTHCNPKTAARRLEKYFCSKSTDEREPEDIYVVLVDEMDYLVTPSQEVLYDLFNLPIRSVEAGSKRRLVVIGVSNTLTLPDNLHPRVKSRVGSSRIFFKAYSVDETKAILTSKIASASPNYAVFHDDAILFASKKTAALSGDIRKAFNICKQAAEMILTRHEATNHKDSKPIVNIRDVLKVSRESFNSAVSRTISMCSPFEALLLVALGSLSKTTGREYGGFDIEEVLTKMVSIADAQGDQQFLPPPNLHETLGMIARLGESHIVSLETPRDSSLTHSAGLNETGGPWPIVSLPVDDLTILLALKETKYHTLAQKYLAKSSLR